ncbi:MAG: S66 family peptidase [bacterium]
MRYGKFLPEGGTIGFLAPSFGCVIEPYATLFDSALDKFSKLGFKTVLGPNCREDAAIGRSNRADLCGKELTESFLSEESDVLISCGGGELMCEILPFVDWSALAEAGPKWYLGFSDNTNYTFLAATLLDTAAIYGPCAASFGQEPWHPALADTMALLEGKKLSFTGYQLFELTKLKDEEHPLLPYNVTEKTSYRCFVPDDSCLANTSAGKSGTCPSPTPETRLIETGHLSLSGRLLGGCIDCLENLVGTQFDRVAAFAEKYKEDGVLWFLESCDLTPMSLRRSLWHMRMAGWFKNASGFLFGRPYHYGEEMLGLDMTDAVTGALGDLGVPILFDADFGHLPPAIPIVTGAVGKIEATREELTISYALR